MNVVPRPVFASEFLKMKMMVMIYIFLCYAIHISFVESYEQDQGVRVRQLEFELHGDIMICRYCRIGESYTSDACYDKNNHASLRDRMDIKRPFCVHGTMASCPVPPKPRNGRFQYSGSASHISVYQLITLVCPRHYTVHGFTHAECTHTNGPYVENFTKWNQTLGVCQLSTTRSSPKTSVETKNVSTVSTTKPTISIKVRNVTAEIVHGGLSSVALALLIIGGVVLVVCSLLLIIYCWKRSTQPQPPGNLLAGPPPEPATNGRVRYENGGKMYLSNGNTHESSLVPTDRDDEEEHLLGPEENTREHSVDSSDATDEMQLSLELDGNTHEKTVIPSQLMDKVEPSSEVDENAQKEEGASANVSDKVDQPSELDRNMDGDLRAAANEPQDTRDSPIPGDHGSVEQARGEYLSNHVTSEYGSQNRGSITTDNTTETYPRMLDPQRGPGRMDTTYSL